MTDPDFQPFLADSQISISPLVAEDWAGLYAVASDPLIWTHHPATDRWQEPVFRVSFDQSLASGGAMTVRDRQCSRAKSRLAGPFSCAAIGTARPMPR